MSGHNANTAVEAFALASIRISVVSMGISAGRDRRWFEWTASDQEQRGVDLEDMGWDAKGGAGRTPPLLRKTAPEAPLLR
jgi:hypothetical protein